MIVIQRICGQFICLFVHITVDEHKFLSLIAQIPKFVVTSVSDFT